MAHFGSGPLGDCYRSSLLHAEELAFAKASVESGAPNAELLAEMYRRLSLSEPIQVVHGTAIIPEGPDRGTTTGHSWVEVDGKAFETSNGQMESYPVQQYYKYYSVTVEVRYSPAHARQLADNSGHYGPWHK
jgi:hypothetical protein